MNGHKVLRQLCLAWIDTPILILSSEDDTENKLKEFGSIRISYALPNNIEQKVNAGGAHGPSRLSGLAI